MENTSSTGYLSIVMVVLQGDMSKPQNLERKKKLHSQAEEWLQAENDVFFSRLKHLLFQVLGGSEVCFC